MSAPVLEVRDLSVMFGKPAQPVKAVDGANLVIQPGEIVGVVGESGSGKTTLCAAIARALPPGARMTGQVSFDGLDLLSVSAKQLRDVRRQHLTMVLQNPMTSFDPLFTIGDQFGELLLERGRRGAAERQREAIQGLRDVHLTAPEMRMGQLPHEMSGGMKQRVLIAMATTCSPKLVIADEPTSALDATIQEEILILLREARNRAGTSILIVSHDLGAIRRVCDRVLVMYAGRVVEEGGTSAIFDAPLHPYTRGLIASLPRMSGDEVLIDPIPGQAPRLDQLGEGCAFAPRCPKARERCGVEAPPFGRLGEGHVACWYPGAGA